MRAAVTFSHFEVGKTVKFPKSLSFRIAHDKTLQDDKLPQN